MMPVVKQGPVEAFLDAAIAQLKTTKEAVVADEALRQQALQVARGLAYVARPEDGCCQMCIQKVTSRIAGSIDAGALTFIPYRTRSDLNGGV